MDQTTSQLTNEELNCFMDKWENEALVQMADQAEERGQTEEINHASLMNKWENEALVQMADQAEERGQTEEINHASLMNKWENEALVQMADQAEERDQSQELNSFMDMWEKEEKEAQDVERGQSDLRQLQPTQEQKVRKFSI